MSALSDNKAVTQIKAMLQAIPRWRLVAIGVTAVSLGIGLWAFANWRTNSNYRPLYKALAPEDAGAMVAKLKEKNVPYHISDDGSTISVPQEKLAEMRLEMASAGLPKTGRIGFELLDQTKFGATDFMEHVNYRRALEGELERTIASMTEVEQARVHLTFAKDSVFTENRLPAKASIVVKLRAPLPDPGVSAIRYMVASAVESLQPEAVSIVDMRGNVLGRPKEKTGDESEASDAALEYRRNVEKDLTAKLNTTLEPLLGAERFRTSVVAECDFSSGEMSEESYDPAKQVVVNDQRSKETTATGSSTGVPGTQSNLPRATPRPGTNTQVTRETTNTTYQTSRTVKRTKVPQGSLKRLSVSVLVDQPTHWEGRGPSAHRVPTPPSQETMTRITDVVSAAVGLLPERGDKLVVESLPFGSNQDEPAPPALEQQPSGFKVTWENVATALALIAVLGAGIYMFRTQRKPAPPAPEPVIANALPEPEQAAPALPQPAQQNSMEQLAKQLEEKRRQRDELRQRELAETGAALKSLADSAIELAQTNSELCAGVLRNWLSEEPTEHVS